MDPQSDQKDARFMRAIGLKDGDFAVFGKVFATVLNRSGLDGADILEKLRDGQTAREALGLPQGTSELLYARAHHWLTVGRIDRAEPLFRALTILDGTIADHWLGLGICLRLSNRLEEAEQAFSGAITLQPTSAIPYFHVAELFLQTSRQTEAARALMAFEARTNAETPPAMLVQAQRFKLALSTPDTRAGAVE